MKKRQQNKKQSRNFIDKLSCILNRKLYHSIISWDQTGENIYIYNKEELEKIVLPKYFKHNQFSSFQRQLNKYGFEYIKNIADVFAYKHPHFRKSKISKKNINVQRPTQVDNISDYSLEYNQETLKQDIITLQRYQSKIRGDFFEAIKFYTKIQNEVKGILKARAEMKFVGIAFISYFIQGIKILSQAMKFNEESPAKLLFQSICKEMEQEQISLIQECDSQDLNFVQKILLDLPMSDLDYLCSDTNRSSVQVYPFDFDQ